jgi:hypothetical protein
VNGRGRPGARDLLACCAIAIAGSLVLLISPEGWIQAVLLGALVLATTGYAVCAALFPPGALEDEDRWVYSFVFSIAAAAIGGLALQLLFDLGRGAWATIAALIAIGASASAWQRRRAVPRRPRRAGGRSLKGAFWAVGFLVAAAIGGVAIAVATSGVHEQQSRQRFASLWAVPSGERVEAGVWNHGAPARYRLEVRSGGRPVESRQLRLAPNQRWSALLGPAVSASGPETMITLYHGRVPYRSVELNPASGG